MSKLYKIVGPDGEALHGGKGRWHLPKGSEPGEWMTPVKGDVIACSNGYHLVTAVGLIDWLHSPALVFEAEGDGERDVDGTKTAFRRARLLRLVGTLNDHNLRHFAADCAQFVLPLFEARRPNDDRPRKAIQAARDFADGKIDDAAMAAAGDAAGDAAGAAAGAAAGGAAGGAARAAAGGAAWDAAWDAAWGAAWAAAGGAERERQAKALLERIAT